MFPNKHHAALMPALTAYITSTDTWTDFIHDFSLT